MTERVKLTDEQMIAVRALRGLAEQSARNWGAATEALVCDGGSDGPLRAALFGLETTRMAIEHAERSIRQALKDPQHD